MPLLQQADSFSTIKINIWKLSQVSFLAIREIKILSSELNEILN